MSERNKEESIEFKLYDINGEEIDCSNDVEPAIWYLDTFIGRIKHFFWKLKKEKKVSKPEKEVKKEKWQELSKKPE